MPIESKDKIPEDLKFLLPDAVSKPIVIGDKAYELYPLTEGGFEMISLEVTKLFDVVYVKGEMSPIEYLMQKSVLSEILSVALSPMTIEDIQSNLTAKQMVYAAAVLWEMNFEFDDFGADTKENFNKVLAWMGMGALTMQNQAEQNQETPQETAPTASAPPAPKTPPTKN